eukprot:Cvel_29124.t2-p1 / transcript=Cvel_29124.t2 / gene=Cvel_29124 / organism=Chromera_velia_CCMP2878 / gene_product=NAD-dependent protein deacylase sirtuin-5,, putative / transcript_product=NAD-dependent protein deacylase sirtuin-5,, putative / location=Cvel_scaffold3934:1289-7323(+) / protein_length=289 / sequence_SO=supercontig / SO=protein_coding / is_pseudo=false
MQVLESAGFKQARTLISEASRVLILTGAGVSAESGIPTFRGAGGLWRQYQATDLATPQAFRNDPSLVWEFYHYRRDLVSKCEPNPAHLAIAAFQKKAASVGRIVTVVTQNIDRLHQAAGARKVIELHGSLWLVKRETEAGFVEESGKVWEDRNNPICPALEGKGSPEVGTHGQVPLKELPHVVEENGRLSLLRPAVVWFGEGLDPLTLGAVEAELELCDLMIVAGTSSVVYPAAGFAPIVAARGAPIIEVNLESTAGTTMCTVGLQGKAGEILPALLGVEDEVQELRTA